MRAAVMAENGAVGYITLDPVPRTGELLLRVSACRMCGSDLKARSMMPTRSDYGP